MGNLHRWFDRPRMAMPTYLTTPTATLSNFEVKGPQGTQHERDEDRSQAVHGPAGTQNLPTEPTPTPKPSHE
jgi:hypothetical protein